jgi:two-component system, OmpR family, phosphate regulon sensor histidine kinase PhoR
MLSELLATLAAITALILWRLASRRYQALEHGLRLALTGRSRSERGRAPALSADAILLLREVRRLADQAAAMQPESYRSRLYERLLDQLRQGVIICGPAMRITFASRAVARLFPSYTGQHGLSLTEALRQPMLDTLVNEAAAQQTWRSITLRVPALDGNPTSHDRTLNAEAAPLPTAQGQGVWLIIEDITERVLIEQVRQDFVANASHELRTPLTLILGYIETLQDGMIEQPTAARRSLGIMEKHSQRLLRLVEDMLTVSRFESSADTGLKRESFVVEDCVRDVLAHLTPLIESRQPIIELQFPSRDVGLLHGDRFYWDQVFSNLIENALKENAQPGLRLTVTGEWHPGHCLLSVSDDGVGIPAHDVPFVFKRFYRAEKQRAPGVKGTGLGLSIVKRAVEAHGGSIELASTPGRATTFTMRVPLEDASANAKPLSHGPKVG